MNDQAAFWDERYKGEDFAFGTAPNEFLVSQAHYLKPGLRALVPGDGEGRNGVWLAEQGLVVDTVDVSPLGVAKARRLAQGRGVEINVTLADLLTWAWPRNTYDIVAALYIHFFDRDRPKIHRAIMEALKPGGILIRKLSARTASQPQKMHRSGGPKTAEMLYSKAKPREDFTASHPSP